MSVKYKDKRGNIWLHKIIFVSILNVYVFYNYKNVTQVKMVEVFVIGKGGENARMNEQEGVECDVSVRIMHKGGGEGGGGCVEMWGCMLIKWKGISVRKCVKDEYVYAVK